MDKCQYCHKPFPTVDKLVALTHGKHSYNCECTAYYEFTHGKVSRVTVPCQGTLCRLEELRAKYEDVANE